MTGDPALHAFYDGYFTGPHHPPRPWPAEARAAADARIDRWYAETHR